MNNTEIEEFSDLASQDPIGAVQALALLTAIVIAIVLMARSGILSAIARAVDENRRLPDCKCGSGGGPAWRKANGKCASWEDHRRLMLGTSQFA